MQRVCSVKGAHPSRHGLLVEDGLRKSGRVGVTDGREEFLETATSTRRRSWILIVTYFRKSTRRRYQPW